MGGTMETVAVMIILLVIIVAFLFIQKKGLLNFVTAAESCTAKTAGCFTSCGNRQPEPSGDPGCQKQYPSMQTVCCKLDPDEISQSGLGQRGEGANKNVIKLIINKNSIPYGQEVLLDQDTLYKFDIVLDETARTAIKDSGRVCSIVIRELDQVAEPKVLPETETTASNGPLPAVDSTFNQYNSLVVACSDVDKLVPRYFKPTELDAGRRYELDVIVYDKYVEGNFSANPKLKGVVSMPDLSLPGISADRLNLPYDNSHWVANYFITLKVKQIVEIADISTTWVAQDDITVNTVSPWTLESVAVAVVSAKEMAAEELIKPSASLSENLYNTCTSNDTRLGIATRYATSLYKISRINTGTEGIILGIGKDNFQTASYSASAQAQPIPITNKRSAVIHLDAASFIYGYYGAAAVSGVIGAAAPGSLIGSDSETYFFRETNNLTDYFLCVKASVSKSAKEKSKIITAFSIQPLRIDIAPPSITNDDSFISVNYPKPFQSLTSGLTNQLTGQNQYSNYYFQEYPYIEITNKCFDKSGCKNFDYYFAPTRIPVNVVADNTKDAVVSVLIGEGLNMLYKAIVDSNPLKTVCPLADSGKYRRNTNNQIRFYDQQGVFCIKVTDGAGNYWLTWKAVYNPYSVVEKVVNSVVSTPADAGTIVPKITG